MSASGIIGRYRFKAGTHEFEKDRVFVDADEHDESMANLENIYVRERATFNRMMSANKFTIENLVQALEALNVFTSGILQELEDCFDKNRAPKIGQVHHASEVDSQLRIVLGEYRNQKKAEESETSVKPEICRDLK